jgi:hypothetical protein
METIHERPEWIINYNKPMGTEIKYINGHWYLYERKSVWDAEKGRPKKKSGKLLGTITEVGLILKQEKSKQEELVCYEFGASYFIYKISSSIKEDLIKHYDKQGLLLYCISSLMLKENIRISNVAEYYKESYLKILEGRLSFTIDTIKNSLKFVLNDEYFKKHLSVPSFETYKLSFIKDDKFYFNKKYLEIEDNELLIPLYYLVDLIKKSIDSYLADKGIEKDSIEVIDLLKTFHVFRDNRKYIKAKPLKCVEKLIDQIDMSFEI